MWGVSQQSTESALGLLLVGLLVVLLLEIIEGMLYYFFTRMILKKRLNLDLYTVIKQLAVRKDGLLAV